VPRSRRSAARQELPEPLPPGSRTVGQVVAEAIRLYGQRFWSALALGVGPATIGITLGELPPGARLAVSLTIGPAVLTASYIGATVLATGVQPTRRSALVALAAGVIALLPVPFLLYILILPAVAWLALVGLVVPVVIVERRGLRAAFGRAVELARASYVHALGVLATLTVVGLLTTFVLFFLLRDQGEATLRAAGFFAVLVVSPLIFLGAALLYFDQEARAARRDAGTSAASAAS
jgi:hypothetical protein